LVSELIGYKINPRVILLKLSHKLFTFKAKKKQKYSVY